MEFYFRKGGRNLGPLSVFRVRDLLESGELTSDDLGWHDGMTEWLPISKINALQSLKESTEKSPPGEVSSDVETPEFIEAMNSQMVRHAETGLRRSMEARRLHAVGWQRFLARTLDLLWFGLLALGGGALAGWIDPGEMILPRFPVMMAVPLLWVLVDAVFIYRWGATPGKALLGLRVVSEDGKKLTFKISLNRAFDVWFFGCGLEAPMVSWIAKLLAMSRLRQTGRTSWDAARGLNVEQRPVSAMGVTLALALFVSVMIVKFYVFFHTPLPGHLNPEERVMWENIHPKAVETKASP